MQITRRGLVAGVCVIAGMGAIGGATKALAGSGQLLRPPGGQDEERLIACCIKCDRCWSICPHFCISLGDYSDGIINARTPKLDFHLGYCDFCGKCWEACPTGAIVPFDPYSEKIGVAKIDQAACLSYTRGACDKCLEVCQFDALIEDENHHPVVVEDLCNGCGACVDACAANVFGSFNGGRNRAIEVERRA